MAAPPRLPARPSTSALTDCASSVWLAMAAETGSVALLIGRLDWDDIYAEQAPWAAYACAVRSGRLVGVLLAAAPAGLGEASAAV
ncbi:hypothetical protein ACFV1W_22560 [Kitasatospora sp. NPDC059648]|uniref:hypothetical protein n=1 Tax=Kitasatospora sp. NPDC059648 TaxID=3346894 RepID=UPI0036B2531C